MSVLNQVDYYDPTSLKMLPDLHEAVLMECSRLIHAAVVSKRFLNALLVNPITAIEAGFCGERFSFTWEEKQQIINIRARSLAEFSQMLLQAVQQPCCIPAAPDMAFTHLEPRIELSA